MNITYVLYHVSMQLHTIVRSWHGPLTADTQVEFVCAGRDLRDDNLPLDAVGDYIEPLSAEEVDTPLILAIGSGIAYAYIASAERNILIGPICIGTGIRLRHHAADLTLSEEERQSIHCCTLAAFIVQILLLCNPLREKWLDMTAIIKGNCLVTDAEADAMTEPVADTTRIENGSMIPHGKTRPDMWTAQCKDYIFQHLHERVTTRDVAEHLHLNANYLSEIFRGCEGMTVTDYILLEKVNLARNMLTYSPYSYAEIASHLGFSSQSHLGKVFKKYAGLTPRQYREQYGQNTR